MKGVHSIDDLRRISDRRLPRAVRDSIEGGAGREITLRRNREGFERLALLPRAFADGGERSLAVTVCGEKLALPVMAAPCAMACLVHREGELAIARASAASGTTFCVSLMSSYPFEEIAAASSRPLWFELFSCRPRDFTTRMLDRIKAAGCTGLMLAANFQASGIRPRDLRNGFALPTKTGLRSLATPRNVLGFMTHPLWLAHVVMGWKQINLGNFAELVPDAQSDSFGKRLAFLRSQVMAGGTSWEDLRWLRHQWAGSLIVKGVMAPEDARMAADVGVDGIVVSNHGGRQLDSTPAAVDALPMIVEAVGTRVDVLVDGGVRHGTDVLKALALGAKACLVGRPWWWGLAAGGELGVAALYVVLAREIDNGLALLGERAVADVHAGHLFASAASEPAESRSPLPKVERKRSAL